MFYQLIKAIIICSLLSTLFHLFGRKKAQVVVTWCNFLCHPGQLVQYTSIPQVRNSLWKFISLDMCSHASHCFPVSVCEGGSGVRNGAYSSLSTRRSLRCCLDGKWHVTFLLNAESASWQLSLQRCIEGFEGLSRSEGKVQWPAEVQEGRIVDRVHTGAVPDLELEN